MAVDQLMAMSHSNPPTGFGSPASAAIFAQPGDHLLGRIAGGEIQNHDY